MDAIALRISSSAERKDPRLVFLWRDIFECIFLSFLLHTSTPMHTPFLPSIVGPTFLHYFGFPWITIGSWASDPSLLKCTNIADPLTSCTPSGSVLENFWSRGMVPSSCACPFVRFFCNRCFSAAGSPPFGLSYFAYAIL